MTRPRSLLRALGAACVLLTAATSCGLLEVAYDNKPCETADDCGAPFLCCTQGIATQVSTKGAGPVCVIPGRYDSLYKQWSDYCENFLPHLVEDNPCGRAASDRGGVNECRAGLGCCSTTLTCTTAATCPLVEVTPAPSTGAGCLSDDECSAPEVCCGITWSSRTSGVCKSVDDCRLPDLTYLPGVAPTDPGGPPPLDPRLVALCKAAACPGASTSAKAIEACVALLSTGTSQDACPPAIERTRPLCSTVFGWADDVADRADQPPIIPASCLTGVIFPVPDPIADACAKLSQCGLDGGAYPDYISCFKDIRSVRYAALRDFVAAPGCEPLAVNRPPQPGDPCAGDTDCTAGERCSGVDSCPPDPAPCVGTCVP